MLTGVSSFVCVEDIGFLICKEKNMIQIILVFQRFK